MNHNHLSCPYLVLHVIAFIVHCIILPSATAGEDYTAISQQFTFGPNTSTSFCVSVDAATDDLYDDKETLSLTFTSADQSVELNPNTATVTIQDDTSKPQHMFQLAHWYSSYGWLLASFQGRGVPPHVPLGMFGYEARLVNCCCSVSVVQRVNLYYIQKQKNKQNKQKNKKGMWAL